MDNNNQYQPQYQPQPPVVPGKSNATCALVCGIISLVFGAWLGFVTLGIGSIVALVLGIVACIQASKAKKLLPQGQTGAATAGLVCGIIGIVLSAIGTICGIATAITACAITSSGALSGFDW